MRKAISADEVISIYLAVCEVLKEAWLISDYRRGNREGKKIVNVFKELEKDITLALDTLPFLFEEPNPVARSKAAAHCISLGILINESVQVLEEVAVRESETVIGFNAKMTLKVWREQGYLKVYPSQEKYFIR